MKILNRLHDRLWAAGRGGGLREMLRAGSVSPHDRSWANGRGGRCREMPQSRGVAPHYRLWSAARRRGAALLAVLWLSAALSAIAFSVATSVRGEIERASTTVDGVRSHYLAVGGIDRTICYMLWGPSHRNEDGTARFWKQGQPRVYHQFPAGDVIVEVIPITALLNINVATDEEIFRLMRSIGANEARSAAITAAIIDWRQPMAPGAASRIDMEYLGLNPSFRGRHASFEQIEEVLLVQGMTPELFYGGYFRDDMGRLVLHSGVKDCITVYGGNAVYDVNSADPALLRAIGIDPGAVERIVERRRLAPILPEELGEVRSIAGPAGNRLVAGGNSIFTLRATARVRRQDGQLSDMRQTVAALVKFLGYEYNPPYHVLRWYDHAPTTNAVVWQ